MPLLRSFVTCNIQRSPLQARGVFSAVHYRVQCAYNGEPVADLELAFADLYPDFDKLQAENAPVAAAAALPQEEASAPAADRPLPAAAARPQA